MDPPEKSAGYFPQRHNVKCPCQCPDSSGLGGIFNQNIYSWVSLRDFIRMQLDIISQQYSNFDVKMTWDIKTIDRNTVIAGFIQNIRYAMMENIEIWVALLDSNGKTVSRAVDLVMPSRLDIDETNDFRVMFPIIVPHGAKLIFTYKYDGFDGGDGTKWMQSFDSCAP